jgi:hypothetical protein
LELPIAGPGTPKAPGAPTAPKESPEADTPVALAVGEIRLVDSQLILEDRTLRPPVTWQLDKLNARAKGSSLDGPIDVDLSAEVATGGTVAVKGEAWLDGRVELTAQLERLVVEPVGRYLKPGERMGGQLSGSFKVSGPAASPQSARADLTLTEGAVQVADLALQGRISVQATLEGGLEKGSGRFEIDGTDAALVYGEAFKKPRGKPATVSGRFVPGGGAKLEFDDVNLRLHNLGARGRAHMGQRIQAELDAAPFELAGWGDLLPGLAPLSPGGKVGLEKIAVRTNPLELRGRVTVNDVRLKPPDREAIALNGSLEATGTSIRSNGLEATVGDQKVALAVEVTDLPGRARYRVAARTDKAESNSLLTALAGLSETLYGPLTGTTELSGPIGGDRSPLEAVTGQMRVDIGRGRLRGVSFLRSYFERLGAVGEAAMLLGALKGGKTLQRFYGDEFESVSGTFIVGNGRGRTDDLRVVYRNYTVDLRGAIGLLDEKLDLSGTLTIDKEVDAALQASTEQEATPAASSPRVIPLGHVGGTVRSPRVEITREAAAAFASRYAASRQKESLERKIDERLGEGAGRELLGTLEQILGGKGEKKQ